MRVTATLLLWGMCCLGAQASPITYITPTGAMNGGHPVDASVTFTTGPGMLTVTLNNFEANPTADSQNLSDLSFTIANGTDTGASFESAAAPNIDVADDGTFTTGTTFTTPTEVGWVLSEPGSTAIKLDVLGQKPGPAHTIIGPPGASDLYSAANGSIAGSHPHNPFLNQTATWVIDAPNVSADTTITAVTFSLGTMAGEDVNGIPAAPPVAEPASMVLLGSGLLVITQVLRRKRKVAS